MADDIKKDADAQRAKQAPQPRVKESGDASLSDVVDTLKQGNQEQAKTTEVSLGLANNMVNIANSIESFGLRANAALDNLGSSMMGNKLKELETQKEDAARDNKTNELLEELVENTDTKLLESPKGFFGTALAVLGGLAGALAGILGGFVVGVGGQLAFVIKNIAKPFTALFSLVGKGLANIILKLPGVEKAKSGIAGIRTYLKNLNRLFGGVDKTIRTAGGNFREGGMNKFEKRIKNFGQFVRRVQDFGSSLANSTKGFAANISNAIKGFFGKIKIPAAFNIVDDVKEVGQTFESIKNSIAGFIRPFTKTAEQSKTIGKLALMIIQPFRIFAEFFKVLATKFAPVGRVLGKLFLPITIIMGIFDGIRGGIEGAAKEEGMASKFIGGIAGAIKGILIGLVGMPLDLLKDLVGWIAGKLGFENAAESLATFSFSDIIGNIIDTIREFFSGVVDFAVGLFTFDGEKIKEGFGKMTGAIGDVIKSILRTVLPDPSADLFTISGIASRAIPDFVYEYAGINPETGEMAEFENDLFAKKDSGEKLNQASIENEDNKKQGNGVNQSAVLDQSVKQSTAQTINIMGGQPLATQNELRFQG